MTSKQTGPSPALIMVAPNGARRTRADHPALPVTIAETAATALACLNAGAGALHLHVRDAEGSHSLDPGLYREAIGAVTEATDGRMFIQITTEAVGQYRPDEQVATVKAVMPDAVSVAVRELSPRRPDEPFAAGFYHWADEAGIRVQHILYSADDVYQLSGMISRNAVPGIRHAMIFVLGRYAANQQSDPSDLDPFLQALNDCDLTDAADWMVCAFGASETACLADALARGGHARIGFENSLWNADGSLAQSNEARVSVVSRISELLSRGNGRPARPAECLGSPAGGK